MPGNDELNRMLKIHLRQIRNCLREHKNFSMFELRYHQIIVDPLSMAIQLSEYIGGEFDVEKVTVTMDLALYGYRAEAVGADKLGYG